MDLEKEVEKINKSEIKKIFNKLKDSLKNTIKLDEKRKYILTIDKFEVFFRLYIDKNIQVIIRTNTLNSKEQVNYSFTKFDKLQIDDIQEYRKNIKAFYKNIIKEVINTVYAVEHHNEMIPTNATQEEIDKSWCTIYEQRLLTELDYNKIDKFKEWLKKVTDKKYILEQKGF